MCDDIITLTADSSANQIRIEKWLSSQLTFTRNAVDGLVRRGNVSVNGITIVKTCRLKEGDTIKINIPEPVSLDAKPQDIPLDIVYEDNDLLVVNKSKGMVVHPAAGNYEGTLVNALLYHCGESLSSINGVIRPGIVHRIDKNTSGLLIVAKNNAAHTSLAEQIKSHSFTREYQAVASGHFKENSGSVNAPIGRSQSDRKKMCVTAKNSKNAVTHYCVLKQYKNYAHIKCILETGRTHQIRVHMAYIGHSIYGDDVYGKACKDIEGQCLHAGKIGFIHPVSGKYLEFESPLPDYFKNVIGGLKEM